MIVNYKEGGWEIITQRAHGILAAQVGAHWKENERPQRWIETVLAIAEHDDAENELDGENLLTATGGPLNFDMKIFELPHCRKLSSLTITKSRYIALLTSMHMVFLYSKEEGSNAEAKNFLDEQRKLQATWRKELGIKKEEAEKAYTLLEWCDALSLLLCKNEQPPENRRIDISTGPDGKNYQLLQTDETTLSVLPWPFHTDQFSVSFEYRTIAQIQFSSSKEFREVFLATPLQERVWTFQAAKTARPEKRSQKKV
jgi:hypothetical protein